MPSLDMHGIHMLHTITWRAAWHEHCMGHARSASPAAFAPPCLASLHTRREPLHTSQHTRPLAKPRTPFLLFPFRPRAESDPKVNLESEKLKRPNPESRTENSHRDTQPKPRATRRDPMVCNTVQLSDCLSPDPKCPHRVTCRQINKTTTSDMGNSTAARGDARQAGLSTRTRRLHPLPPRGEGEGADVSQHAHPARDRAACTAQRATVNSATTVHRHSGP
jgi:hypothetical protein